MKNEQDQWKEEFAETLRKLASNKRMPEQRGKQNIPQRFWPQEYKDAIPEHESSEEFLVDSSEFLVGR